MFEIGNKLFPELLLFCELPGCLGGLPLKANKELVSASEFSLDPAEAVLDGLAVEQAVILPLALLKFSLVLSDLSVVLADVCAQAGGQDEGVADGVLVGDVQALELLHVLGAQGAGLQGLGRQVGQLEGGVLGLSQVVQHPVPE
jgi:hypothetical protein